MKPHVLVLYNDAVQPLHGGPKDAAACHENSAVARDVAQTLSAVDFEATIGTAEAFFSLPPSAFYSLDVIFNLCEGFGGDSLGEGPVAGWLTMLDVPFTGNSAWTLSVCRHKALTKTILSYCGIPTPRSMVVHPGCDITPIFKRLVIVKPLMEDASHGISDLSVMNSQDTPAIRECCRFIHETWYQPALVEEYIDGREFNTAILGGDVLPLSEIDFSLLPADRPKILGYDAKWDPESDASRFTPSVCPAELDRQTEQKVKETAVAAARALKCRGYARIDIRLAQDGTPYVLEVNPNPSLHQDAGFRRSAAAFGLTYAQLLERIARMPMNGKVR